MLLVALLTGSAQFSAWRATRAARQAFNGERALLGADEALAQIVADWNGDAFAESGIGSRRQMTVATAAGDTVAATLVRTAPLIVWLEVAATSRSSGAPLQAARRVARALLLAAPSLPLDAALVALAPVHLHGAGSVTGIDDPSRHDECGAWRDSASIAGLQADVAQVDATANLRGAPPRIAGPSALHVAAAFDSAWLTIDRHSAHRTTLTGGEPAWQALILQDTGTVQLNGVVRYTGLLAVDGDLVVNGVLQLRGLLVVRGTLDTRLGQLDIDGGAIIGAHTADTSHLGARTTVRYAPCARQRALAAVAQPTGEPFQLWAQR